MAPGKDATFTVTLTRRDGYAEPVALSVAGLPANATADAPTIAKDKTEAKIVVKTKDNTPVGAPALIECQGQGRWSRCDGCCPRRDIDHQKVSMLVLSHPFIS